MVEPVNKPRPNTIGTPDEVVTMYIYADVLEEIRFSGQWRKDRFSAGLLIGRHYRDPVDEDTYIEIEGFIGATHVHDLSALTRHLRTEWKVTAASQQEHFPSGELLGWYTSGVNEEGRRTLYSDQDILLLHHTFFPHPWQNLLWVENTGPGRAVRVEGDSLRASTAMVIDPES